jgi:hypothetical protein
MNKIKNQRFVPGTGMTFVKGLFNDCKHYMHSYVAVVLCQRIALHNFKDGKLLKSFFLTTGPATGISI